MTTLNAETISAIVNGLHGAPFDVLGSHPVADGIAIRTCQPQAQRVTVLTDDGKAKVMEKIDEDGFFEAAFPDRSQVFHYRLKIISSEGESYEIEDPYRFPPILGEEDL